MTTQSTVEQGSTDLQDLSRHADVELEMLRKQPFNWPLAIGFTVVVLAVIGFLVIYNHVTNGFFTGAERSQAPVEEVATLPAAPPTPLEQARTWQDENLAATVFGNLPIQEHGGRIFLVYVAASGDSISGIVQGYLHCASWEPADRDEILRLTVERHAQRYHRGLWPGDVVLLQVPRLD